jgi:hypothetical protein
MPASIDMTMEHIEDEYIRLMGPCRACQLNRSCWRCIKPDYNCGLQHLMELETCQDVVLALAPSRESAH